MADFDRDQADTAQRFGRTEEWFVASREGDVHMARIGVVAERAVDLLHVLSDQLDPAVDVVIESIRDGKAWTGDLLALPDVREVIGRLRLLLATYGGVEVTVMTADDQLTLTPELALVIYSRSDRWLFVLEGLGLVERAAAPKPIWQADRRRLSPVAALTLGLANAAERLGLAESLGAETSSQ